MNFKFLYDGITNIIQNPVKVWDAIHFGNRPLMYVIHPPDYKKIPLLIAATATFIALFITTNWLLTRIIDKLYFTFFA